MPQESHIYTHTRACMCLYMKKMDVNCVVCVSMDIHTETYEAKKEKCSWWEFPH